MEDLFTFWDGRHAEGQTGWHRSEIHRFLTDYTSNIDLSPPKRVFVPLCGRCLELLWFYQKGLNVVGVEIIEPPVKQFFEEHKLPYVVENLSWAKLYKTEDERLKVFVCSIYDTDISEVGKFDVIWDRGSLTAVERADRDRYVELMKALLNDKFLYLLATLQFDDTDTSVPVPKSISHEETNRLYSEWCNVKFVATTDVTEERLTKALKTNKIEESYILMTPK